MTGAVASGLMSWAWPGRVASRPLSAGSEQEPRVQCSFCGKCRDQVAGLVVSSAQTGRNTQATICTECLGLCTEIVTEELGEPSAT